MSTMGIVFLLHETEPLVRLDVTTPEATLMLIFSVEQTEALAAAAASNAKIIRERERAKASPH